MRGIITIKISVFIYIQLSQLLRIYMKKNRTIQVNYQKRMEERLKNINNQLLNDSLTNPLLKRIGELPDYFKDWINGSKLVAVIPALEKEHVDSNSYYSVGAIINGNKQNNIRISPVHMYINDNLNDLTEIKAMNEGRRFFMFDSEESKLYSREKILHSKKYQYVKKENFDDIQRHIIENPVVLFFQGCDDGHVGKRFKNELEAITYLQIIDAFEDIFDNELEYHN